jgi:hypothetical protein
MIREIRAYVSATVVIPNLFRNLLQESMRCRNKFGMTMVGFGMTMVALT